MLHLILRVLLLSAITLSSSIDRSSLAFIVSCDEPLSMGNCTWDNQCDVAGYMCDSVNDLCCPVVDYTNDAWVAGPALDGECQDGFAVVNIPGGQEGGECVNLISIPGLCPITPDTERCDDQWRCPPGFKCFNAAYLCCPEDYSPPL
ncbi:hypothetical protein PFISCL1PPCAC_10662 [Pristionchus fissidentatus]|uniref:Uncharacterized protein n=1 Tax=Pristionchus fissidentatus TaxID=1538716 RepID=A0AAV5VN33_9BILA|nr:hypothetical protein PFISCL1PPCAC_10662 [Pristionchus fissidentatus]